MRVGTVFLWNRYPYQNDGVVKNRWFIYLGQTDRFSAPIYVHIATSTTQTQHYRPGGSRADHKSLRFKAGEYGFCDDCLVDPNQIDSDIQAADFERCVSDGRIEILAELPEELLRRLYDLILQARHLMPKIQLDIHAGLNGIGISGLKKPGSR